MLDIRWIRENAEAFDAALARRGLPPDADRLLALDQARRDALTAAQEMQARRNALSKEIGQRKGRGEDAADMLAEVARCKQEQADLEARGGRRRGGAAGGAGADPESPGRRRARRRGRDRPTSSCAAGASRAPSTSRRRSISSSARRSG